MFTLQRAAYSVPRTADGERQMVINTRRGMRIDNSGYVRSLWKERYGVKALQRRTGAVLLAVLLIVITVSVLCMGFLAKSDVEFSCGNNMVVKRGLDIVVESGIEHAKGLLLNPQETSGEYFTGASAQQLVGGSDDYYDITVTAADANTGSTYRCDYTIDCTAYTEKSGERTAQSSLRANLRLDPCIGLWLGSGSVLPSFVTISGDTYCGGQLLSSAALNGDVFTSGLTGASTGQQYGTADLSLSFPSFSISNYTSGFTTLSLGSSTLQDTTLSGLTQVYYRNGNLALSGNVAINGMLLVNGNLTISNSANIITAKKNIPAVYVTGDLILGQNSSLNIEGLVVCGGRVLVYSTGTDLNIVGGLFVNQSIFELTSDYSGYSNLAKLYNGASWQPTGGHADGALSFDGTDDYAQTDDSSSKLQISNDYTFSVWIKADATQKTWAGIFSKTNDGSTNHWTLQFDASNPRKLVVHHSSGNWHTEIKLGDLAGSWHHIVITRKFDNSVGRYKMTSYLDGGEKKSGYWDESPGSGYGHLNIGVDRTASSNFVYKGLIDDLRIYNVALTPAQIGQTTGLIGYWKFDEGLSNSFAVTVAPAKSALLVNNTRWGQAAGSFFRSIEKVSN
ncbi:MAG: LamG domain-containing protein [Phycisphaerae bacterium]|nr:LamG domain-containing protein [Phycisphaerae bacterium]